jgi:fatty acid desaturase
MENDTKVDLKEIPTLLFFQIGYLCLPNWLFVLFFVIRVVLLLIVMFCVLFVCKCVLPPGVNPIVYCHRVSTQLQLTNISNIMGGVKCIGEAQKRSKRRAVVNTVTNFCIP